MPGANPYLRLKHTGLGNPADFPDVDYRAPEGRDWPFDVNYGLTGPPSLSFSPDGRVNSAVYGLRIEQGDLKKMIPHILGYADVGVNQLVRKLPINDPDGFGMVAVAVEPATYYAPSGYNPLTNRVDPFFERVTNTDPVVLDGEAQQMYRYADLQVRFAHVPYQLVADNALGSLGERERYMVMNQQASSEYVQLDRSVIYWTETGATGPTTNTEVATGAGLIRNITEVTLTWFRLPFSAYSGLIDIWRAGLGTVNNARLDLQMFNTIVSFDEETMLFQPWRSRDKMGPLGFPEYDVELRWLYRNNRLFEGAPSKGWNHFLYPPDGNYYRAQYGNGLGVPNKPIYPTADHTLFFEP